MIVEASAIVAILNDEPEREAFLATITASNRPAISALSVCEAALVMMGRRGPPGAEMVFNFIRDSKVQVLPFDLDQALAAQQAYLKFGKGFNSSARLNLCDCGVCPGGDARRAASLQGRRL